MFNENMVIWPTLWIEPLAYLKDFGFLILHSFWTSEKDININICFTDAMLA